MDPEVQSYNTFGTIRIPILQFIGSCVSDKVSIAFIFIFTLVTLIDPEMRHWTWFQTLSKNFLY